MGHDLGHTAFGHTGETVLDEILRGINTEIALPEAISRAVGRFKHNYQSLRVVDLFERRYDTPGLNLSDQVREAILKHGLTPAKRSYDGDARYGWWTRSTHNWNQVCNGGMTLGALAIYEDDPDLAQQFVHRAVNSVPLAMRACEPDGAYPEGPGYWEYDSTTSFIGQLSEALEDLAVYSADRITSGLEEGLDRSRR